MDAIDEGITACQECGGPARVLPGESYAESDAVLFAELAATVGDAGITPAQAEMLAAELEPRGLLAPGRCLRRLVQVLPSLGALEPLVLNEAGALRKAEGMLATLLYAMARGRRRSGIIMAVTPPSLKASSSS